MQKLDLGRCASFRKGTAASRSLVEAKAILTTAYVFSPLKEVVGEKLFLSVVSLH